MRRALLAAFAVAFPLCSAAAQSQEECIQRWERAEQGGIVYGAMVGGMPTAVVDEPTWNRIDFATKVGLAETFSCAVAGPGKTLSQAEFRSNLTNRVLGEWNLGRLEVK